MNLKKEVITLRMLLNLTQTELAKEIKVSFETINRWETEKHDVEEYNVEKVYTYAYQKKIYLNQIYEQLFKEDESDIIKILFHGCKSKLDFPIDLSHSKINNDFGLGFYLGENLLQASTYIANSKSNNVYAFRLDTSSLVVKKFNVSKEWLLAISYYRGWLNRYKDNTIIKDVIKEVENSDVIVAPIADNRMFDIISEFVRGEITDLQCEHALAATNLGMQYVIRTNKAIENISFIKLCYLSEIEKKDCINKRMNLNSLCLGKVKVARIEYRGKGQYIDELLR